MHAFKIRTGKIIVIEFGENIVKFFGADVKPYSL